MPIDEPAPFLKPSRPEREADSWAFALELYARPGVANACLELQNRAAVDVMMLLMVAYAAVRHRLLLTPSEIGEMDEACRPWREQIVHRLRAIRTGLKAGPSPAPGRATEEFRSQVKSVELAAERLQNQLLANRLPLRPAERDAVSAEDVRVVLRRVVTFFLETRRDTPIADLLSPIEQIVAAAIDNTR